MTESASTLTAKGHADHLLGYMESLLKDNPNKEHLMKIFELDFALVIALAGNEALKKAQVMIEGSGGSGSENG